MSATTSSSYIAPPTEGIKRLEHFVNDILKVELVKLLTERDVLRDQASQCVQARQLFRDMAHLRHAPSVGQNEGDDVARRDASPGGAADGPEVGSPSRSRSSQKKKAAANKASLLVNLGNHFYIPAVVKDATTVYVNIGCGVVLAMSTDEAESFLEKREKQLREKSAWKTRESLKLKYRIKLVTEAIARLNERTMGIAKPEQ
ncbi:protein UXT [Strigomonas culicis]|uniref:Protein UXT n=1 Tax=Strigomonas culicis TaxID=28005 RepID=S9V2B9_9TRYP|nr:protein UXT [Strigomonas culicis]|eukprot:EPY21051.1 protein UXT [Strigomonas culicis]